MQNSSDDKPWIHFIGIAGVAVGQIAVEFKRLGYIVTGSEKGLFPPMSDHILQSGMTIELGYKSKHLDVNYYKEKYSNEWSEINKSNPDLVVLGGTKGEKNPEYLLAVSKNIPVKYYPEILQEYALVKDHSIVVAGTYGKTTTTAMIAWVMQNLGFEISFMFGGLNENFGNGVRLKNEKVKFSILEGDEYIISRSNPVSKFTLYSPKYLLLTSAQWDHTDVFKTKEEYLQNFEKLIESVPEDGLIVYNEEDKNIAGLTQNAKCTIKNYSAAKFKLAKIDLQILGDYNQTNAIAAYVFLEELFKKLNLNFDKEKALDALKTFKGIKRRLEIRYEDENRVVIDDFGASPPKARVSIDSVKSKFPDYKIFAVFEPNLGSRTNEGLSEYSNAFDKVDRLYLPHFTKVQGEYISNLDLQNYLKKSFNGEILVDANDDLLIENIVNNLEEKTVILFLGSHGFRGMIEKVISKLHNNLL